MGTYTANKNLYMPTVGEQGWGTLMNTNLSTIDNFLKPITVSGSTYTFTGNHVGNQSGGSISATSITNSGTLTNTGTSTFTGKITGNGGIGTTSLTTSSTITSTGQIVANGGVKGKLNVSVTPSSTYNSFTYRLYDYAYWNSSNQYTYNNEVFHPITLSFGSVLSGSIGAYISSTTNLSQYQLVFFRYNTANSVQTLTTAAKTYTIPSNTYGIGIWLQGSGARVQSSPPSHIIYVSRVTVS